MNTTTKTQEVAELLASHEYVLKAVASGRDIIVEFPRERGGRFRMTLPAAKKLLARLKSR